MNRRDACGLEFLHGAPHVDGVAVARVGEQAGLLDFDLLALEQVVLRLFGDRLAQTLEADESIEAIVGVSLAGYCRMRFRRYPPAKPGRAEMSLDIAPRSIYTMQGAARWQWQHSVSPTKELRYSITFRTRRV